MTSKEICGECMVTDNHDSIHYTSDEWHENLGHCAGCNPSTGGTRYSPEVNTRVPGSQRPVTDDDFKTPEEWEEETEEVVSKDSTPVFTKLNTRTTGYHFGPLTFRPGKDGVREVLVGDPGIPGVVSIKIEYKGTGKRPSIYTVPIQLLILEEEELPIEIVQTLEGKLG